MAEGALDLALSSEVKDAKCRLMLILTVRCHDGAQATETVSWESCAQADVTTPMKNQPVPTGLQTNDCDYYSRASAL